MALSGASRSKKHGLAKKFHVRNIQFPQLKLATVRTWVTLALTLTRKSIQGCGLAIVKGNDNDSARVFFMHSETVKKTTPVIRDNDEHIRTSAKAEIASPITIRERHESSHREPPRSASQSEITLPTFIEIV